MDYIFSAEQIEVPKDLAGITKAWTKEVIRYGPADVVSFSRGYFEAAALGDIKLQDFLHKYEEAALTGGVVAPPSESTSSSTTTAPQRKGRRRSIEDNRCPAVEAPGQKTGNISNDEGPTLRTTVETGKVQYQGSLRRMSVERTHDPPPIADDFTGVDKTDRKRVIFQKAFSKYDVDGDNRMSTNELRNLLGDLRWDNSPSALAEAKHKLDKDGNGMIDLEEFLLWSEFAFTHQAMLAGRKISLSVKQDSSVLMKPVQKQRRKSILANLKEDDEGIEEEEEEEGIEEGNEED